MKSNVRKISIVLIILSIILSLSIFYINKQKTTQSSFSATKAEIQMQEVLQYREIEGEIINQQNSQYDTNEDGNIIIMEYCGQKDSVEVPKELDGYKVTEIDSKAFSCNENLEMIKIPIEIANNIKQIDEFEVSQNLSSDEYIVYITTKEYSKPYLDYIKLTAEEKSHYGTLPKKFVTVPKKVLEKKRSAGMNAGATLPSSYNLKNDITIRTENQGESNICYAYGVTKSIETYLTLNKGVKKNFSEVHMAVGSDQYAMGDSSYCYRNYLKYGHGPVEEKSSTMLSLSSLKSMSSYNATARRIYNACVSEEYENRLTETQKEDSRNALNSLAGEPEYYVMKYKEFEYVDGEMKEDPSNRDYIENNRNSIKESIMNNGSVVAWIATPTSGNYYDYGSRAVQRCSENSSTSTGFHTVSLIGWNDNFSASNFPSSFRVTNNGAWLALNSWGSTWGNGDGTFWISYDDCYVECFNEAVTNVSSGKVNVNDTNITLSKYSYDYDGLQKTPVVTVDYKNQKYEKGVDYTVEYGSNTNVGTATATITGKGRFTGSKTITFTINSKTISTATVRLATNSYIYDGTAKIPEVMVKVGSKTLTKNTDYTVEYSNNRNIGKGTVTITGIGTYTGTISQTFTISAKSISDLTATLEASSYIYDGTDKTPEVTVKYGNTTLTKNTDYTVEYSNNTNVGTGTVTITGKGNYEGTISRTFTISAKSISDLTATLEASSYIYDGTAKTPEVTVKDGNTTLTKNTDYTVKYSNNTNAGTGTVTLTGKGNYEETISQTFTISAKSISDLTATLETSSYIYDGTAKTPEVTVKDGNNTLTNDTDYTVEYSNNTNVGTGTVGITGKGNYEGTISQTFTISAKNISNLTATLETISYTYDGTAKTPKVTVKDGDNTLTNDTDYTVEYSNNINKGTGTVTITGIGIYTGTISQTFTISAKSISDLTATLETSSYIYDGTDKTPEVTVKDGDTILTKNTDYTVEYSNNTNVGTATATMTGDGNYTGKIVKTFDINKSDIEIENKDYIITYDGSEHGIIPNIITKLENPVVRYGTSKEKINLEESPKYADVGKYKIYYEVSADNYNNFIGSINIIINAKSLKHMTLTLNKEKYEYNEKEKKPQVTVKDEKNKELILDKDYKVEYSNNIKVGNAEVTVTGIGNYKETLTTTFHIEKGVPTYTVPSGLVAVYSSKLSDVALPEGFSFEDDLSTEVGEVRFQYI